VKLVCAVVDSFELDKVREALVAIGIQGATVSEVQGIGSRSAPGGVFPGTQSTGGFTARLRIDVVVQDGAVDDIMTTIAQAAATSRTDEGTIFTMDVRQAVRIRTGDRGEKAL